MPAERAYLRNRFPRSIWLLLAIGLVIPGCAGSSADTRTCSGAGDAPIADIAIRLVVVDDTAMTEFIERHLDSFERGPAGITRYTLTTNYETRTVYLYLIQPLDEDGRREVRRALVKFSQVEKVLFCVKQEGGIVPE